jgi:hypothetical protein
MRFHSSKLIEFKRKLDSRPCLRGKQGLKGLDLSVKVNWLLLYSVHCMMFPAGMLFGCIIGKMQANALPWLAGGAHGLSMTIILRGQVALLSGIMLNLC